MLDAFRRLFSRTDLPVLVNDPKMSVAALLIHLAAVDGTISPEERRAIRGVLMDTYALDEDDVDQLIAEATRQDAGSVDFYRFTSALA